MISNLNILDSVEICITDKMLHKHYYRTKVQDIGLNNVFYTMIPSSETGRPVMFFKEQVYELYSKGKSGILYWQIKYLGIEKIDNISSCKFQAIEGPTVTQRREFFRQSVSVNLDYYIADEEGSFFESEKLTGRIIDLSGGGCAFMSSAQITLRSKMLTNFCFRGIVFEMYAEVLDRIDYSNTRADWDYKYRIRWINTPDKVIDHLIKLVFEQQKEMILASGDRGFDRFN
ncbi:MAG: flagellar brake protein [Aminipila sp.]